MGDSKKPPRPRLAGGKGSDADSDSDSSDSFDDDPFARDILREARNIERFGPLFSLLKTGVMITDETRKMTLRKLFRILAQGNNLRDFYSGVTDKETRIFIEGLVRNFRDEVIGNTTFGDLWSNLPPPQENFPSTEAIDNYKNFATQQNVVKRPKTPPPPAESDGDSDDKFIDNRGETEDTREEATEMMRPLREEVERAIVRISKLGSLPRKKFQKWLKSNKSTSFGSTLTDQELLEVLEKIEGEEYAQNAKTKGKQYMVKVVDRIARDATKEIPDTRNLDLLKDVKISREARPPKRAFEKNRNTGLRTRYDEETKTWVTGRGASAVSSGTNNARDASRPPKRRLAPEQLVVAPPSQSQKRQAASTDFSDSDAASVIGTSVTGSKSGSDDDMGSSVTGSESGSDDDMGSSADETNSESGSDDDMGSSVTGSESGSGTIVSEGEFPEVDYEEEGENANGSSVGSFYSAVSSLRKRSPSSATSSQDSKRQKSADFTDSDVLSDADSIAEDFTGFTRNGSPPRKQRRRELPQPDPPQIQPIILGGDSEDEEMQPEEDEEMQPEQADVIELGGSSDNDEGMQVGEAEIEDESEAEETGSSSSEDEDTGRRKSQGDDDSSSGDDDLPEVLGRPDGGSVNVDFTSTLAGLERLRL